ncbi:ABC transporter permease [Sansalvadorimonas verongulae]|uniref:ABC transporter permease n=1 Tax=Sansalvadorimonas verongulae TaxID=2172824 RepID=UPI0012BCBB90|nr:ABC transporter permease [Sansalvadorimonas verongulae]MTI14607.1 ABC transporter permease [Sansalvadorimonas verongulae]
MDMLDHIFSLLGASIRMATPLIFAAMAGIYSERSGVVDIGLEGKMLFGAFAAAVASFETGNPFLGLLAGIVICVLLSLMHGYASVKIRGDQVISGLAVNFLASGLTVTLGHAWYGQGGLTPALTNSQRFTGITLPGAEWLGAHVPVIGPFYEQVISGHNLLVYAAFAVVALTYRALFSTRFGLHLRATGEEPNAVDSAGISVAWVRYRAVLIAGVLCGFAGAYLSIAQNAAFQREMTSGRGYIALAAVIFGKWHPKGALGACLLFGFLQAMETRMQNVQIPMIGELPSQLFSAIPYIITVVLLAGFIGKAVAPKAIGVPYVKER